jgi:chitodextrinase
MPGMHSRVKLLPTWLRLLCGIAIALLFANTCAAGTATYNYDANGRPSGITYDNGVAITYQVDANGNRTIIALTGNVTPPSAPGALTFTSVTTSSAVANWGAATPAGTASIAGYDYQVNAGLWTSLGNVLSVSLTGLTMNTTYTVAVRARDSAGNVGAPVSGSVTPVDNVPPSATGTPVISAVGGTTATATWTSATDNIGVTGYEYSINGGSSWTSVSTALSVNLAGLTSYTGYTFYVRAFDAAGNRGAASSASFTTTDITPPSAPSTPTVSNLGATTVTLSWTASSDNAGVTGYEYSINAGSTWTGVGTALTVNLSGLTPAVTYTFYVRAFDAAGNRGAQSSVSFRPTDTTPPSAPGTPTMSSIAATSAIASWTASSDNVGVSGYEYSMNGGSTWTGVGNVLTVNLTGLSAGVSYTFSVRAFDAAGNRSAQSSVTFSTVDNVPPSAPGTPSVASLGATTATLNWSAATDNVGVTGYEYSINGGSSWTGIGTALTVNLTGLTPGVTYTFYVRAFDAAGNRGATSSVSFRPTDTTPPSAPGTPTMSSITATSAVATWTAATDNVGVTGYEYSINGGSSWTGVGTALSVSLSGLSPVTAYTFYVRAFDAAGNRSTSTSAGFTTSAPIMTVGTYSSGGVSAYGFTSGYEGSISPLALSSTLNFAEVADLYSPGYPPYVPASQTSGLYISGFTADPGINWLVSVTANGVTRTAASASYSYSNGTAYWLFANIFGLQWISGGTTPVTVIHN